MTLNICWFFPLPAAVIAEVRGFNADRGLVVRGTNVRSSDEQYELLASGAADAGMTAMDNVFDWNGRGAVDDLRIVAEMERSTHSVLMGAPGIDSFDKLKGGVLVVDAPANGFVVVTRTMLRDAGLEFGDYRTEIVGGIVARAEALASGKGDAALLVPLFEQKILAAGGHVLGRVDEFYPDFPGQGLAIRRSALPRIEAALRVWLEALRDARDWAAANPGEAVSIVAGEIGIPAGGAEGLLAAAAQDYRPSAAGLERIAAQRAGLGLPGAEEGVTGLFEPSLIGLRPS